MTEHELLLELFEHVFLKGNSAYDATSQRLIGDIKAIRKQENQDGEQALSTPVPGRES
jgi:hypothetical protein